MASALLSSANAREAVPQISAVPCTLASQLAARAVQALLDEAGLTPKPSLVDQRGNGAHADLTLALMRSSARALFPCFAAIATACGGAVPSQLLREQLGVIGRRGERQMFAVTDGANTHKGAIWSLGLLVAGTALCKDGDDPQTIASTACALACYPDSNAEKTITHGARARQMYGVAGAQGEARQGFPHVLQLGLPALRSARARGMPETCARLDALLTIMADLGDTCLLHRGGLRALHAAQCGARRVLSEGGISTARGMAMLLALDAELVAMNASPGGSADLLAATLFLDSLTRASEGAMIARDFHGDLELWKD